MFYSIHVASVENYLLKDKSKHIMFEKDIAIILLCFQAFAVLLKLYSAIKGNF